jgi:hypothetical protein
MKKILLLVVLCAGLSITSQAQSQLFLDYTQAGWFWQVTGAANTTYTITMTQLSGSGQIQFSSAFDGTYEDPHVFSVSTDGTGVGQTLYFVKGIGLGGATLQACITGAGCNTQNFTVVTINSLVFQAIDSPLDTNPNTGGGNRIYPDRTTPSDATNRRRVRVRATLSSASSGVPITFKSFDLDDPSANTAPLDPDTNGPNSGDDNRASTNKSGLMSAINTTGTTDTVTVNTDASGIAEADFTVTMNPGDNFMAAASGDPNIISGITIVGTSLQDSGHNTLPVTKAKNTSMLTVWRKVHLEVDNMGPFLNRQSGTTTTASVSGGQTFVNLGNPVESGRYQPGKIIIGGNKTYDVASNTATQVVINQSLNVNQLNNKSFTLFDDDDYDSDNPWKGDEDEASIGTLNALANLTTSNVYAPAYITPVNDGGGNMANNSSATGYPNIEHADVGTRINAHKQSTGNDNFWVGYIQIAYQGGLGTDMDPATEFNNNELGITIGSPSNSVAADCSGMPQGALGSLIYQETQRDLFAVGS